MNIHLPNRNLQKIYNYIKLNDGQNILYKDIRDELLISYKTIRKHMKWLERRGLIIKNGKRITLKND